jgi:hypothetical protein
MDSAAGTRTLSARLAITGCGTGQNVRSVVTTAVRRAPTTAQSGGSARGYQGLFAWLAIPIKAAQTATRSYLYASSALGMNFRSCRRPGHLQSCRTTVRG